jgi:hypothetical protein
MAVDFTGKGSLYFTVSGGDKLVETLAKLQRLAPLALGRAVYEEAEAIGNLAKDKYVPRDFGTLAGSFFRLDPVITKFGVRQVLGFGGGAVKYAWVTHENPRAGKTGGVSPSGKKYKHWADVGEWKYLEKAMNASARHLPRRLAARIKRDWAGVLM